MRRLLPVALLLTLAATATDVAAAGTVDWPAYLNGPAHGSYAATATAITTANASTLGPDWTFNPLPATNPDGSPVYITSSPTVVDVTIYIGASNGYEYALNESTGGVLWSRFLGFQAPTTCPVGMGITSTAAYALDPLSGDATVYVGGGDGYLYALDAATGAVHWRSFVVDPGTTENTGYDWSSPTLVSGHIVYGIASNCDKPLVRGGLRMYDQATGALQDTYWAIPSDEIGAGIWTSASAEGSAVWVGTGDVIGDPTLPPPPDLGDSTSIVRLRIRGTRLVRKEAWAPPMDVGTEIDLGSSTTLFDTVIHGSVARMVGICDNGGRFFALRRYRLSSGAVWSFAINGQPGAPRGLPCYAAAIWRPSPPTLVVSGRKGVIDGVNVLGTVRSLNPATGQVIWETALQDGVVGSPAMNGNGVISVITYSTHGSNHYFYLMDASDGSVLFQISTGSLGFSQPVFADQYVFVTPFYGGLTAYCPGCTP